jgi:hypothetical protein
MGCVQPFKAILSVTPPPASPNKTKVRPVVLRPAVSDGLPFRGAHLTRPLIGPGRDTGLLTDFVGKPLLP